MSDKFEKIVSCQIAEKLRSGWTHVIWSNSVKFLVPVAWLKSQARLMGMLSRVPSWPWAFLSRDKHVLRRSFPGSVGGSVSRYVDERLDSGEKNG